MAESKDKLLVELEGPDLDLDSADPLLVLTLARSYFELLEKIADQHASPLQLRGLRVESKCVAVMTRPDDLNVARQVATDAGRYIGGALTPPPEVEKYTKSVRRILKNLPKDYVANVIVGPWAKQPLQVKRVDVSLPAAEITEFRGYLISIGGRRPAARFSSRGEGHAPFSLKAEQKIAKQLAPFLYTSLDVTARLERDERGRIHSGEVREFVPLEASKDDFEEWKTWFQSEAKGWDDVKDIEDELGRVRS